MDIGEFFLNLIGIHHAQRTADALERSEDLQKRTLAILKATERQTDAVIDLTKIMAILAVLTLVCGVVQIVIAIISLFKP